MKHPAFALLLIATPATAQNIDKTRTDVTDFSGDTKCRFKALPALELETSLGYFSGRWEAEAMGMTGKRVTMRVLFTPIEDDKGDQVGAQYGAASITVFSDKIGGAAIASAKLALDDDDPAPFDLSRTDQGESYRFGISRKHLPRLDKAKQATLTLQGADGANVATFTWDVSSVRGANPLLAAVNWHCRDPRI